MSLCVSRAPQFDCRNLLVSQTQFSIRQSAARHRFVRYAASGLAKISGPKFLQRGKNWFLHTHAETVIPASQYPA
jgi:hypothetical protein